MMIFRKQGAYIVLSIEAAADMGSYLRERGWVGAFEFRHGKVAISLASKGQ